MAKKSLGKKILLGVLITFGVFIVIGILSVIFVPFSEKIAEETAAIKERTARLEQENAEKNKQQEEIAKFGIWQIGNFVDEFGESTKEKYIYNKTKVTGSFSNSATKNSPLNIKFMYSEEMGLGMELYEYAGTTPAHILSFQPISINVQDKNGTRNSLKGVISKNGTRIFIEKNQQQAVKNILISGGIIKFRISIGEQGMVSTYAFDIDNADGFEYACSKL
jgi:hypothetical protein